MENNLKNLKSKLSFKEKFGYGLGDFANVMSFGMTTSFLMKYYTDAIGISGAMVGTMFLLARFWDAITDVLMGIIVDKLFARRTQKYIGKKHVDKFKPFFKWGAWFVSISSIMMFLIPQSWDMSGKIGFMYTTYILWGMCYTFVNIPYGSLASAMTLDSRERASLSVARGLGSSIGQQFPKVLAPFIIGMYATDLAKGYFTSMLVFSIIALVSYYACYFLVKENVEMKPEKKENKTEFSDYIKVIFKNRPLIGVAVASIAILAGLLTAGQMMLYYFDNVLDRLTVMGTITLISIFPTFIVSPFLPKLVEKYSTKRVTAVTSLIGAIGFAVMMFLPENLIIYGIFYVVSMALLNIPMTLIWGMVSDCIDYNQYLTGNRQEGVIYGSYSFIRKIGQALSGFIAGIGLQFIGYIEPINGIKQVQSASTIFGIKFMHLGFTAICAFIGFCAFQFIWNLDSQKREEIINTIRAGKTIND